MPSPYAKQIDRIESALIGNGHEGLLARTARIEENLEAATEAAKEAKEKAQSVSTETTKALNELTDKSSELLRELSTKLTQLAERTQTHMNTEHLSSMMKTKNFWLVIIGGYVALHIISSYVPAVWNIIMALVGLPHLVAPFP